MRRLLSADWVRFGARLDLWFVVALVPIVMALIFLSGFRGVTTRPDVTLGFDPSSPPDPQLEADMRAQIEADFQGELAREVPAYAFPASVLTVVSNPIPMVLLAIYLTTALVAGEFEWGTVRTVHLTSSRARTLAVRILVVTGVVGLATALGIVVALIAPFLLSVDGVPLQHYAAPTPNLLPDIGAHLLVLLPVVSVSVLASVLARATGLAFLLTILFFVVDLSLTGAPFWAGSPVAWIPAMTFTGATSRLLGGQGTPLGAAAPAWLSILALVGWTVLPAVAAIARFRQLDLIE